MIFKILIPLTIYVLFPLIGLLLFIKIKNKMTIERIISPPLFELLMIFVTYGGLLLVVITSFLWEWSGMASLGVFYLILGAPFIMGYIGYRQFNKRMLSKYNYWAYKFGVLYFVIAPLIFLGVFLIGRK